MNSENSSEGTLKAGALGTLGVAALGVVMMAPALGIYGNLGPLSAYAGKIAPAVFLAALLCIMPSAVSYALIARELPSAGSAYTWLSEAINPFFGTCVGLLQAAMFFFAVILQPILFGLFLNDLVGAFFHNNPGYGTWMIGVLISTLLVALLAYPGIQFSAEGSVILTIVEATVVLALACTILVVMFSKRQIDITPFNPLATLQGSKGFFRGLVFALLSFTGFGVITTAAEETHAPRSVIPRVVILACVFLGLFWAFTSWGFCLALQSGAWGDYVKRGINPVAVVANQYWLGGSIIVAVTAITAVIGVYLGSVVGYSRIAYAMGRDRALPALFGRVHPEFQVPWNAQHVVLIAALIAAGIWGRWLGLYLSYAWWGSVVVFFAMLTSIFVNMGCGVYFYRFRREVFSWFWHATIPLLGMVASLIPLYYSFGPEMWRSGWKQGQSIILFCAVIVIAIVLYTGSLSRSNPDLLRRKPIGTAT